MFNPNDTDTIFLVFREVIGRKNHLSVGYVKQRTVLTRSSGCLTFVSPFYKSLLPPQKFHTMFCKMSEIRLLFFFR